MNRKGLKITLMLLIVVLAIAMLTMPTFAVDTKGWKSMDMNMFDNVSSDSSGLVDSTTNIVGNVITVIQVVGMGVAIIMLIYMAIKYISAAPSEKAEYKKSATAYVVGALVLFAATGILQILKNFSGNITGTSSSPEESGTGQVIVIDADEDIA